MINMPFRAEFIESNKGTNKHPDQTNNQLNSQFLKLQRSPQNHGFPSSLIGDAPIAAAAAAVATTTITPTALSVTITTSVVNTTATATTATLVATVVDAA